MDICDFYIFVQVKRLKAKYAFLFSIFVLYSCNITKKVPQDAYLFRNHDFKIVYAKGERINRIDLGELEKVARIRPTRRWLFTYLPLRAYNAIDQERLKRDIARRQKKTHQENLKKLEKQRQINEKRIARAMERGDTLYRPYRVKLRDTIKPRVSIFTPGFSFRYILNSFGEEPVLLDPNLVHRSADQIRLYLEKKGYYHAEVRDSIILDPKVGLRKRKRQAIVHYHINLGKPHTIDSIYFEGEARRIHVVIDNYLARNELLRPGDVFDREILDGLRSDLARQLRNETFYEFSPSHIIFKADTTIRPYGVILGISILPRTLRSRDNRDSIIVMPQRQYRVGRVYFHISDTSNYNGNFTEALQKRGLSYSPGQFFPNLDTFRYEPTGIIHAKYRKATFLYNGQMPIKPEILEMKNYLEDGHWYRSYYLDRSYNQLLELDIFQTIQPVLIDRPDSGLVDVHYYLVPSKVQGFTFEPRATNSNGFLGVSASINYRHRNLLKSGGKFTASLSGGMETQPPLIDAATTNAREQTYEIGPTVKLVLPGLMPISYLKFSKRQTTTTEFSAGFNYQRRREFDRNLFQFNYLWRWRSDKLQTFQMGLPLVSGFKFVRIDIRSEAFKQRLVELNDLFLINAYSNQLVFNDFKFIYNYSNERLLDNVFKPKRLQINYDMSLDLVGNSMALFTLNRAPNDLGQKTAFGIPFSQFFRMDNEIKFYQRFSRSRVLAMRLQGGLGYTYGNSTTMMPFDYAFFAGGSNDNRGWHARELSPGAYQYHRDLNRTITQIGDIRLGASVEYRFKIPYSKRFQGAAFTDAGNIWTLRNDPNRPGAQFGLEFYKQLAISGGLGIRMDLTFLVIRFDVGVPIHNPAMSRGADWIWNSRALFEQELDETYGNSPGRFSVPRPFVPKYHFAIGFPF
jgi:outer membrane protein assembly factor BamA